MKRYQFITVIGVAITVILLHACQKSIRPSQQASASGVELGQFLPSTIMIHENDVTVGFMESAQGYTIDITGGKNESLVNTVKAAISEEAPLRVFVKEGTLDILNLQKLSEQETKKFKEGLFREGEENEALKTSAADVIPSQSVLNSLFNTIKNRACRSSTVIAPAEPCITFNYIVDGCYARAHKMRQILLEKGYDSEKQFVYGDLWASNVSCCTYWTYHVAPLVKFKNSKGKTEERIIDPSLFPSGPVTQEVWREACKIKSCARWASVTKYATTSGKVYIRSASGAVRYDNSYVNTNCVLTTYRNYIGCNPSPAPTPICAPN